MTADWLQHRVDELFVAAIEQPVALRADFLAEAARDDPPEVRELVLELIAADERADANFAARSPFNLHDFTAEEIRDPRIGQRIDDYLIRSRIASGGFGTVYLATREDPYVESVAIKLLHRESLSAPSVVRRVLREMQALSDLRHPHIVTQLQAHVTADGEPYIVMEFIRGRPLDSYCDDEQLSIHERLQLFQKICGAVEFAHQHGWVHRDLKPSNILVTDDGTPKLLDFGIAKLAAVDPVERGETVTRDLLGTPQYMSPEQFSGGTAGPATDIYALGAILYELLTGHRAFDVMCGGIDAILLDAIQSAIKETVPRRPSTLVMSNEWTSTGVSKEQLADQRRSSPAGLKRCLEGDIDNIVMMALRKEPARRYASAAAVAEDIQRWLDHRPVTAHGDSLAYRTSKFARRNSKKLLIGLVVACSLCVALLTLSNAHHGALKSESERARRFIESAQTYVDDDDLARAIVQFHAAYQTAPAGSEIRGAAGRMLAGWVRYLGLPLEAEANIRYAFHPNGQLLSVARPDGLVTIWDISEMRRLGCFASGGPVACHIVSPDATSLLTVTRQGQARCWDVTNGQVRCEQKFGGGIACARLQNGQGLLLQVTPVYVRIWHWKFGDGSIRELATRHLSCEVIDVEFMSDKSLVIAWKTGGKRQVEVWDARSLQSQATIVESALALGPRKLGTNETLMAQSYRDETGEHTTVVDIAAPQSVRRFPGEVLALDDGGTNLLLKDDRRLWRRGLSPSANISDQWKERFVGRWDAAFGARDDVLVAEVRTTPGLHAVVTSVGLASGETCAQRLPAPFFSRVTHDFDRAELGARGQCVLIDNRHDDASASSRVPWLWRVEPFLASTASLQLGSQPRSLGIEDDLVVTTTKEQLQCWTISTGQQRLIDIPQVTCLAMGGNKRLVVAGDVSGTLHFLELPTLAVIKTVPLAPKQAIRSISLNGDGTRMLVTTQHEACLLADKHPLRANSIPSQVATCRRESSAFDRGKLSASGSTFAVASHVALQRRDASDSAGRKRMDLAKIPGRVADFVVTDEAVLAATIHRGAVCLLDDNGLRHPIGSRTDCQSAALRPDGKVLAVGHADGSVQVWDTVTRRRLARGFWAGHRAIRGLAFSGDGKRLLTASESGTLRVWSTAFELPYDEPDLRTALEVLTGYELDSAGAADAPRQLDKQEWCERYLRLDRS